MEQKLMYVSIKGEVPVETEEVPVETEKVPVETEREEDDPCNIFKTPSR